MAPEQNIDAGALQAASAPEIRTLGARTSNDQRLQRAGRHHFQSLGKVSTQGVRRPVILDAGGVVDIRGNEPHRNDGFAIVRLAAAIATNDDAVRVDDARGLHPERTRGNEGKDRPNGVSMPR